MRAGKERANAREKDQSGDLTLLFLTLINFRLYLHPSSFQMRLRFLLLVVFAFVPVLIPSAVQAVTQESKQRRHLPLRVLEAKLSDSHSVSLSVGTPAKAVQLIIDTGSHHTTFPCDADARTSSGEEGYSLLSSATASYHSCRDCPEEVRRKSLYVCMWAARKQQPTRIKKNLPPQTDRLRGWSLQALSELLRGIDLVVFLIHGRGLLARQAHVVPVLHRRADRPVFEAGGGRHPGPFSKF